MMGRYIPADVIDCERIASVDDYAKEVRLSLEAEGQRYDLVGQPLNLIIISCSQEFDFVYGVSSETAPLASLLQPIRYRFGDSTVDGHCERSIWLAP